MARPGARPRSGFCHRKSGASGCSATATSRMAGLRTTSDRRPSLQRKVRGGRADRPAARRPRREAHSSPPGARPGRRDFLSPLRAAPQSRRGPRHVSRQQQVASLFARLTCLEEVLPETAPLPAADATMLVGDLASALSVQPASPLPVRSATRRDRVGPHPALDIGVLAASSAFRPHPASAGAHHRAARTPGAAGDPALRRAHVEGRHASQGAVHGLYVAPVQGGQHRVIGGNSRRRPGYFCLAPTKSRARRNRPLLTRSRP